MIIKELYYYEREIGKFTVSTEKPDCEHVIKYRLIADENKQLTKDGFDFAVCVDVDTFDKWYEVVKTDEENKINHIPSLAPDEISAEEFMALVEEALS